jgi:ribonuclease HIII
LTIAGRIIGVDESGKGDFFGPLVVAGFLAGEADLAYLKELGVRDSKKITDGRILSLDEQLRDRFIHRVVVVMPADYNLRYGRIRNLNILLAECHAEAISGTIAEGESRGITADLAISDKFGKTDRLETALTRVNCRLRVIQMVRGEAVAQVAAASILARAEFIRRMKQLSTEMEIELPFGAAAHVDEVGRKLVSRLGTEALTRVAKCHFKNHQRALAVDLFQRKQ